MSLASHYEEKALEYSSCVEGNTYALLMLAYEQRTANLIAFMNLPNLKDGAYTKVSQDVARRLGLET